MTQAKRQPGSAFKPIVYAAALENGFAPNSIILDAPFVESQGEGLKNWKPENYGKKFYGPTTLRKGIEYSRNLMTVRIAKILGLNKILDLSKDLEIYQEIPELLSVSLGAAETTLINLTSAYASFVNGGQKINPVLISRIQDRRGKTIFKAKNRKCNGCENFNNQSKEFPQIENTNKKLFSEETAYQMVSMLEGVIKRGTGRRIADSDLVVAGKTGTTNDNTNAWFIGFSPDLVAGVYVGYDIPRPLGKRETGSTAAVPIFKRFILDALENKPLIPFRRPGGITLVPVHAETGERVLPDHEMAVMEVFKPGQRPKSTIVIDIPGAQSPSIVDAPALY